MMTEGRAAAPGPPSEVDAVAILCFTGPHARLPHLLATLRRGGLRLSVTRCTTLVDFARQLTRHEAELVGVDAGPGNLRLADAMAVLRRARPRAPVAVVSEDAAEALAATAGVDGCRVVSPESPSSLAALIRAVRIGAAAAAVAEPDPGGGPALAAPEDESGCPDEQGLLAALRPVLLADAAHAALAVLRITPDPGGATAATVRTVLADAGGHPAVVARLGDSYGALLELAEPTAGVPLAHAVRELLHERLSAVDRQRKRPDIAIGISPPRPSDGDRPESWLARVLAACDVAARTEHGYAVLSRSPVTAPTARDIPSLLQDALVNDRLILQFQPIVSLRGDARQHCETLVRLPSTTAGELLPADFFGPARASGLIAAVDHWVIRQAIHRLARERATNRRIHLFIPLCAESLADERVLLAICDQLRDAQAAGDWLTFQLRPQDVRAHPRLTRRLVDGLRQIRCRLALDHYDGEAGCRELLQALTFDFAKLSPTLTRDLHRDPAHVERARAAVTQLAQRGVKSVATAVEDAQTLAYLWTVGIDYAQGFFLQEPTATIAYDAATG